jgi:hypothetical protein
MGYTTTYAGELKISPPLNGFEIEYLTRFFDADHHYRDNGPYVADNSFSPEYCPEQPETHHCDLEIAEGGTVLRWNGTEKSYYLTRWVRYVIDTFLKEGATLEKNRQNPIEGRFLPAYSEYFTFDHVVNGELEAQGEIPGDSWTLRVVDNIVTKIGGEADGDE